ncbi:hypothetical protein [Qipengyuania sp. 483]
MPTDNSADIDIDDEIIEEIEIDVSRDQSDNEVIAQLKKRCDHAKIEVREREYEDGQKFVSVLMPSGRSTRAVPASGGRAANLLSFEFEKYVFLTGLDAICSYRDQSIEASVRGYPIPPALFRFVERANEDADGDPKLVFRSDADQLAPTATLSARSEELQILLGGNTFRQALSLKISGGGFTNQEEAIQLIRKLADSIGFQMDLTYGVGFSLVQDRKRRFVPRRRGSSNEVTPIYPTHEYEKAPISLYWYARDARGLPLLRFLALYQSIEYFFPTYSESEAKRRVALILKDPAFRTDRDSDLARLLTAMRLSRSGFGDEKSQLKAVLNECIDPDELRRFIESLDGLAEHVSGKGKRLQFHRVPMNNATLDLRNDVASRIYDIRCKIVHTKDEDHPFGDGMILPFSEEADDLELDNVLLEFVAQKVLISSSVPIRFSA